MFVVYIHEHINKCIYINSLHLSIKGAVPKSSAKLRGDRHDLIAARASAPRTMDDANVPAAKGVLKDMNDMSERH